MALKDIAHLPYNIQRVAEILRTLWRHGLGHIVTRLNLPEYMPLVGRMVTRRVEMLPPDEETLARRLALVLQELGPTFIKLGQILSTRPDFVPEPYISEFRKLQAAVAPFPTPEARTIIERELGRPIAAMFSEFPDQPFASGSIAQVYCARLTSSTEVVVKVRRPGIERKIRSDIEILRFLARQAERNWPTLSATRIIDEFENAIHKELDFVVEASCTSKFHKLLPQMPGIRSPEVYWDYTTTNVLTMERLQGIRPDNIDELDSRGIDRPALARKLGQAFIKQYLEFGFFHADPHPGNMVIDRNGGVALLDFGMMGHLSDELLAQLSTALIAISTQNMEVLIDVYLELGEAPLADPRRMTADLMSMFDKYYGMPLKRIDARAALNDSFRIARTHGLLMPRDLVMLMRSLVLITSVGRTLDPDFNIAEIIEPEARRLMLQKVSPTKAAKTAGRQLWHISRLVHTLPRHIKTIIQKIEAGTITVAFRHQGLEGLLTELDRVSNRLSISIILAATIVGSSITLQAGTLAIRGVSAIGIAGFLIAGLLGLWLVWDILRSGRF